MSKIFLTDSFFCRRVLSGASYILHAVELLLRRQHRLQKLVSQAAADAVQGLPCDTRGGMAKAFGADRFFPLNQGCRINFPGFFRRCFPALGRMAQ